MHPVRKQKLYTVIFIVVASSAAVGLILYSLGENLNSFYPPAKIASGEVPKHKTIRGGGCVVPGSINMTGNNLEVFFDITDGVATVKVSYDGILPDLFGEGEAAVITGKLNDQNILEATQVLAKHDESYMPPEVSDTLASEAEKASDPSQHSLTCQGLNYAS